MEQTTIKHWYKGYKHPPNIGTKKVTKINQTLVQRRLQKATKRWYKEGCKNQPNISTKKVTKSNQTLVQRRLQKPTKHWWKESYKNQPNIGTKKVTKSNQTSACKLLFLSAELAINRHIQAGLSGYYATESLHKLWYKTAEKRNIMSDFPRGVSVAIFRLITGHDCIQIASLSASNMSCENDITP
jgi:hypothetical protein